MVKNAGTDIPSTCVFFLTVKWLPYTSFHTFDFSLVSNIYFSALNFKLC